MSTAKRSRRRQPEARSTSPLPSSKRVKITPTSHVPNTGLDFLVDENDRAGRKLEARLTNGVPSGKINKVDESHTVVAPDTRIGNGRQPGLKEEPEVIDISSAVEDSSEPEESDDGEDVKEGPTTGKALTNGHVEDSEDDAEAGAADERTQDIAMEEAGAPAGDDEAEAEEVSFGDLLQARHPQAIDVQASFADPMAERSAMMVPRSQTLAAPSAGSLTTVLTQALKTNDRDLLESCFQLSDRPGVRLTIQRLSPQLVAPLLQRLAERIYKRPGRTGNLMVWVQWSMVAHGAYLATQPKIMSQLRSLAQVAHERAQGLQPLLHLKGKLDMLNAQLEHRRSQQAASRAAHADEDDEEDEGVVYIEGQGDTWSDDDDMAEPELSAGRLLNAPPAMINGQTATPMSDVSESGDDDESDDDIPNGINHESDDDDSEDEGDEDGDGLVDVEAEETSADEDEAASSEEDDDSEPESEADTDPSDEDSEPEIKQPPPKTLSRKR